MSEVNIAHSTYNMEFDLPYKSKEEIREIQNRNLKRQMKLIEQHHPYYRKKFKEWGLEFSDIQTVDDLEKIPLTYKSSLLENPTEFRLQLTPEESELEEIISWDVMYTTGTTSGKPTPFFNTSYDFLATTMFRKRMSDISGFHEDDTIINLFPLGSVPHLGYLGVIGIANSIGANLVCTHTGSKHKEFPVHNSLDEAVKIIEKKKGTVLTGISSYIRRVIMRAEELGSDLSSVRYCWLLGESCPDGLRKDIKQRLAKLGARDVIVTTGLGFTEMQGTTVECKEFSGFHNPVPDLAYLEIVDEKTGKRVPDGERGLLVVSHLNRRGTVLLRYVVGDITSITHEQCPHCKRNVQRLIEQSVRTKELVNLRGTLINPTILKDDLTQVSGLLEYQIVFDKVNPEDPLSEDCLRLRIATERTDKEKMIEELTLVTGKAVEMKPEIEFCDINEIYDPTVTLKSNRIVDNRPVLE
ncbi:phenylacetate--CoA ligase family protein [Oceanobacillus salinisoli]|uniref:phenylacetate--CoA ligase family protein n=1 Tax=Oceanobacillus salinisoli TaxID=2678611 RepID=UPI0012E23B26|nr:AMP-binding protein [Oceanobacillus salinisoli]